MSRKFDMRRLRHGCGESLRIKAIRRQDSMQTPVKDRDMTESANNAESTSTSATETEKRST